MSRRLTTVLVITGIVVFFAGLITIAVGSPASTARLVGQNQVEVCVDPDWFGVAECFVIDVDDLRSSR